MYPRVLRQVARVGKRLRTLRALVRLCLAHMYLGVQLQISLRREYLKGGIPSDQFPVLPILFTTKGFPQSQI